MTSFDYRTDFKPLPTQMPGSGFPLGALPEKIYAACADVQSATQAPTELVVAQALGVAAAACQGCFDVELPHGQLAPISLNLLTLGASGERKSTVNHLMAKPVIDFQREVDNRSKHILSQYETDQQIWQAQQRGLMKALEKAASTGDSTSDLKQEIARHKSNEPIRPKITKLIYDQFTPAAFIRGLNENHPVCLILSDEAGAFFAHPRIGEIPVFNTAWNGSDIRKDSATSGVVCISSPRVSLSLQMQPEYFLAAKDKHELELRESGFLARCLVSFPVSTQGFRFGDQQPVEKKGLEFFHARIRELLESAFSEDGTQLADRQCLAFSDRAKVAINRLNFDIESHLQNGGILCSMRDFASKMSEHACRLAAIFHIIEGRSGLVIDVNDVSMAIEMINWYAQEFDRLIVRSMAPTQEEEDAKKLLEWFQRRLLTHGNRAYTVTEINKNGPSKMRNNGRVIQTLQRLVHQQALNVWIVPPTSPKGRMKRTYQLRVQHPLPTAYPDFSSVSSGFSSQSNF